MIVTDYLRFVVALGVVLGLIALFAWIARRFRLGGLAGSTVKSGRLEVVESLPIDGRQRLVLLRRDASEHLVLIGQERSVVIESGIKSPRKLQTEADQAVLTVSPS
ncbi:MAG: flagellar biosynthetic protein FliO [Pseudomonadota bacterium]